MLDQAESYDILGRVNKILSIAENVLKGKYQLVILSPENIVNDTMLLSQAY